MSETDDDRQDPLIGRVLSERYRIDRLIGTGAAGRVYEAEHELMHKRLAVKVLHGELTSVPEIVARFEREAMAAANIDHPNVAAATDFGKLDDGTFFLVLEYIEGRGLRAEIDQGPIAVERALHIARQVASALSAAHALDIVHRDLKPENVMLVEKAGDPDFVKVLDFGIARVPAGGEAAQVEEHSTSAPITKAGMVFGTPEYMAPEQALGQQVDARADIYALGVILFEMLAQKRPFYAETQVGVLGQQLSQDAPAISDRAPDIELPVEVERLVSGMLARESKARVASSDEVLGAINEILSRMGANVPRAPGSIPDWRSSVADKALDIIDSSRPQSTLPAPPASEAGAPSKAPRDSSWLERTRATLPPAVRKVPLGVMLGTAGALLLLVVLGAVVVGVFLRKDKPMAGDGTDSGVFGSAAAPAGSTAGSAAVAAARQKGADALVALTEDFPSDVSLWVELAHALALEKKHKESVDAAGNALRLSTSARDNPRIASVLWIAAQSKEGADAAFELLEGAMGAKGADILYDLTTTEGVRGAVVKRANDFLNSKQFDKASSPALHVTVGLTRAKRCQQRYGLLLRAQNVGDKRTLKVLRKLENRSGCGRRGRVDCNACMRKDDRLQKAIEAIERRAGS